MMDLHEVANRIRATNDANGFESPDWDRLLTKLMLVVTELDEANAAVYGTGKDPLAEELADTAIRLLDILVAVWGHDWNDRRGPRFPGTCFQRIEVLLWPILHYVCIAAESWRYNKRNDTRVAIEMAVQGVFGLAAQLDIDFEAEIESKLQRNAQRGHLHGVARTDG